MDAFDRYAPLVQEFIYKRGWTALRQVQAEAAQILFDTNENLLVCSSTASGKTEAAFFPIITEFLCSSPRTFGVLYIAPLKSLINDQFERLTELLHMSDIPLCHWHGDVANSHKTKALKNPSGILQITPESLESMLINRSGDIPRLFGDLRYIILDELHAVMGSDRGRQILCQLARLGRIIGYHPRRIGLSATIGDPLAAARWLGEGSGRLTLLTDSAEDHARMRLGVEHFFIQVNEEDQTGVPGVGGSKLAENDKSAPYASGEVLPVLVEKSGEKPLFDAGYEYVYRCCKGKSTLVFSNSREETEYTTATLRQMAAHKGDEDVFLIHHGNLSAALREETETKLKLSEKKYTACATVTLELGVDIGQLERIVHIDAPNTVSGFLQRLGRSGRRGTPPEMMMVIREEVPLPNAPLPQIIPWNLLKAIAVIQLYGEERFIEPAGTKQMPMSLLFQQTLSVLMSSGELSPARLAEQVLNFPPFLEVPKEVYKALLKSMIENEFIEVTEEKGLIVGLAGERLTNSFKFYASFKDSEDYTVRCGSDEIGTITSTPPPGDRFALAGRVWEVEELDLPRRLIYVKPVKGKMEISWPGDYGEIHTRILERMLQVLREDTVYPYLKPNAVERLKAARETARRTGVTRQGVVRLGGFTYCMFPWLGTRSFRTVRKLLHHYASELGVSGIEFEGCYYISFKMEKPGAEKLPDQLLKLMARDGLTVYDLIKDSDAPAFDKYDPYIPPSLLRKAYATDRLNLDEAKKRLADLAMW
ncbi:MAG: DEAD/DEAH box helicase [Ruminococcaceae bacterium]|nr:DEAD/DEAH box helicase [Oscillospiraceae bacterium]